MQVVGSEGIELPSADEAIVKSAYAKAEARKNPKTGDYAVGYESPVGFKRLSGWCHSAELAWRDAVKLVRAERRAEEKAKKKGEEPRGN
jgi:hypothetical protein